VSSSRTPTAEQGAAAADAAPRRITLVTDAWHPQVNGVVHTWAYIQKELAALAIFVPLTSPPSRALAEPGGATLRPMR
jgi:hypothetical protein